MPIHPEPVPDLPPIPPNVTPALAIPYMRTLVSMYPLDDQALMPFYANPTLWGASGSDLPVDAKRAAVVAQMFTAGVVRLGLALYRNKTGKPQPSASEQASTGMRSVIGGIYRLYNNGFATVPSKAVLRNPARAYPDLGSESGAGYPNIGYDVATAAKIQNDVKSLFAKVDDAVDEAVAKVKAGYQSIVNYDWGAAVGIAPKVVTKAAPPQAQPPTQSGVGPFCSASIGAYVDPVTGAWRCHDGKLACAAGYVYAPDKVDISQPGACSAAPISFCDPGYHHVRYSAASNPQMALLYPNGRCIKDAPLGNRSRGVLHDAPQYSLPPIMSGFDDRSAIDRITNGGVPGGAAATPASALLTVAAAGFFVWMVYRANKGK